LAQRNPPQADKLDYPTNVMISTDKTFSLTGKLKKIAFTFAKFTI